MFMWYRTNVVCRIWMSLKFGAYLLILSTTRPAISLFRWPCWSRGASTRNVRSAGHAINSTSPVRPGQPRTRAIPRRLAALDIAQIAFFRRKHRRAGSASRRFRARRIRRAWCAGRRGRVMPPTRRTSPSRVRARTGSTTTTTWSGARSTARERCTRTPWRADQPGRRGPTSCRNCWRSSNGTWVRG